MRTDHWHLHLQDCSAWPSGEGQGSSVWVARQEGDHSSLHSVHLSAGTTISWIWDGTAENQAGGSTVSQSRASPKP